MVGEAIEHALAGGQFERAARLIKQHGSAEPAVVRLEALLEMWEKPGREAGYPRSGWTLGARVLLAQLHWHAGRRGRASPLLQPARARAEREEHPPAARVPDCFRAAGPELIRALRQAAVQGIAPETAGKLVATLGEGDAPPVGARPGVASAGSSSALA